MNRYAGYTKQVPQGWWVMLRFSRDSHPKPLLNEGGAPQVFTCELEATRTVNRHLLAYFNGKYLREGEIASMEPTEREQVFGSDGAIYRKGRKIEVERKRAAA